MNKTIAIFLLLIATSFSAFSQTQVNPEPTEYLNKNSIHAYGSFGLILVSAGLHYERIVMENDISIFVHGGIGTLNVWGEKGEFITGGAGVLTNCTSAHHFESSLGINYFFNKDLETVFLPSISAGYRKQKLGNPITFRTGIAFFQGIYVGLGYSF